MPVLGTLHRILRKGRDLAQLTLAFILLLVAAPAHAGPTPVAASPDPDGAALVIVTSSGPVVVVVRNARHSAWANVYAYSDVETAPSAPVDASRYPRGAPRVNGGAPVTFEELMKNPPFFDWQQYVFRNPEKALAFIESMDGKETGFDVRTKIIGGDGGGQAQTSGGAWANIGNGDSRYDQAGHGTNTQPNGHVPNYKEAFMGLYGADRNFNLKLDRGPVPSSVRMRASTVARFNFYDLRVPASIR